MPDIGVSKDALRNVVGITGEFVGTTDTQTLTNKTISLSSNTFTVSGETLGDILKSYGAGVGFGRQAIGAAELPLHVNTAGTDISYSFLKVPGGGTGLTTATGVIIGTGTTAMTTKANPAGAFLGDSDVQNITGGKTFKDQIFKLRNPADTQTLTFRNPVLTSSQDYRFNSNYSYLVFKDGSTYYAKSGITKGIESSNSDAATVIQYCITTLLATSRGGTILFSPDDFPLATPLDIPTATGANVRPLSLIGSTNAHNRVGMTTFSTTAAFPTNRYMIETSGCTDLSLKFALLTIKNIGAYNLNLATLNAGFLKYEHETGYPRSIVMDNVYTQYIWRPLHLIGAVWWGEFTNLNFSDASSSFTGDTDILLEQGSHTSVALNPWPKGNVFRDIQVNHSGHMANSLRATAAGYNRFDNYTVDGDPSSYYFTDSVWSFSGKSNSNVMRDGLVLDLNTVPSPDNRLGSLALDGTSCYNNRFYNMNLFDASHSISLKNGTYRNDIEVAGFWGVNLDIDDSGSGAGNTITLFPGAITSGTGFSKPTTTGSAGNLRINDMRTGAYTTGVSTQSGNGSTVAFNIAHGCYTTPLTYSVMPQTGDALGPPVVTATSTNLVLTYPIAPPSGSSNLIWVWTAGVY